MSDRTGPQSIAMPAASAGDRLVFSLAGQRFALPVAAVEAIAVPPVLARVPHAAPALLGAGNLGGRIIPVLDPAPVLVPEREARCYDGSGEIVRLRLAGRSVGLWVDRIERLDRPDADPAAASRDHITPIDPAPLLLAALAAPNLGAVPPAPLGEVPNRPAPPPPPPPPSPPRESHILVEVAGLPIMVRREAAVELIEAVPWTRLPGAPAGFLGIGILRAAALPVLSLAVLLGLDERRASVPGGFVATDVEERRALLAVDRIVGLRFDAPSAAPSPEQQDGPVDLAAAISGELRRAVLAFAPARPSVATAPRETSAYLAFAVAGQDCALPIACIDRVVEARPLVALPRPVGGGGDGAGPRVAGAIELHGQLVPVAALRSRLGLAAERGPTPAEAEGAYVILRGADGIGAIGVDRITRLVSLGRDDVVPPPINESGLIAGVAALAGSELLRIIAPARLWGGD